MLRVWSMFLKVSLLSIFLTMGSLAFADPLTTSEQIIVVTGKNWDSTSGVLQRYERSSRNASWQKVGKVVSVNLGKNGMAWGMGLHGKSLSEGPVITCERLKRSPVGIFEIPLAFGKESAVDWPVKLPYQQITKTSFCSGDKQSKNYNRIVDISLEPPENWNAGEDMQSYVDEGLYTYGAMIGHNSSPTIPGRGSCFFLHVWRGLGKPTAGCTAMGEDDTKEVIGWLDPQKRPLLVRFPEVIYADLKGMWDLPEMHLAHEEL